MAVSVLATSIWLFVNSGSCNQKKWLQQGYKGAILWPLISCVHKVHHRVFETIHLLRLTKWALSMCLMLSTTIILYVCCKESVHRFRYHCQGNPDEDYYAVWRQVRRCRCKCCY